MKVGGRSSAMTMARSSRSRPRSRSDNHARRTDEVRGGPRSRRPYEGLGVRRGRTRQTVANGAPAALDGFRPLAAFEAAVCSAEQAVELPSELLGIDVGVDLARLLGLAHSALDRVRPVV